MASRRAIARALYSTGLAFGVGTIPIPSAWSQQAPATQPAPAKIDPLLHVPDPKSPTPLFYRAQSITGVSEKIIEAWGAVELRDRTHTFTADWARYDVERDEIWATGNVRLRNLSDTLSGPEMLINRVTDTGYVKDAKYELGSAPSRPSDYYARGQASEIILAGPDHYIANDATYTTCRASDEWMLRMRDLDIDQTRQVGTAHNVTLYFKDVPIMYTPWLDFPLNRDRKSGVLAPSFGSTGRRGFEMTLPYYLNLAPNYDATLSPRIMSKRGFELGTQFRYLFPIMRGELDASYLPHDLQTGSDRFGFAWKHEQNLGMLLPGLSATANINKVSDDFYFTDLSDHIRATSQTILPREATLSWNLPNVGLALRVQRFQTLQDPEAPIVPPYNRTPQFLANAQKLDMGGFDLAAAGEYVHFNHPTLLSGDRAVIYPTVSYPLKWRGFSITPKFGVHTSQYFVDDPSREDQWINRTVPIASLDAGVVLERDLNLFGQPFVQTLEPRAYYLWVPVRNQTNIPNFDSAIADLSFSQLFSENRYTGSDRIGDANQLTLALTSRLINPDNGNERLRLSVGQRFYFADQEVTLFEAPRTSRASDIVAAATGRISDAWLLDGGIQYGPATNQLERLNLSVRYQPEAGKVLNVSYRYLRELLNAESATTQIKQVDISGQWPITSNIYALARWNYSLYDHKLVEGLLGLEYNEGCWTFRLVGQQLATTTANRTNAVFFQLELNGLSRIGTNPLDALRRNIPGYSKTNDPVPAAGRNEDWYRP
ncbi:MAG: LPS-assembly protein LptD [Betaproteobacteria bacterium]